MAVLEMMPANVVVKTMKHYIVSQCWLGETSCENLKAILMIQSANCQLA